MKTSTLIGLKYGAIAVPVWFVSAIVLMALGLRTEFVFFVLGCASLPAIAIIASRAAYAAGKKDRMVVQLHDA